MTKQQAMSICAILVRLYGVYAIPREVYRNDYGIIVLHDVMQFGYSLHPVMGIHFTFVDCYYTRWEGYKKTVDYPVFVSTDTI